MMPDRALTYNYLCPIRFGACNYIYPTTAFLLLYPMAPSCL